MQVIPETAARYGLVDDAKRTVEQKLFDPATNLRSARATCATCSSCSRNDVHARARRVQRRRGRGPALRQPGAAVSGDAGVRQARHSSSTRCTSRRLRRRGRRASPCRDGPSCSARETLGRRGEVDHLAVHETGIAQSRRAGLADDRIEVEVRRGAVGGDECRRAVALLLQRPRVHGHDRRPTLKFAQLRSLVVRPGFRPLVLDDVRRLEEHALERRARRGPALVDRRRR